MNRNRATWLKEKAEQWAERARVPLAVAQTEIERVHAIWVRHGLMDARPGEVVLERVPAALAEFLETTTCTFAPDREECLLARSRAEGFE